METSLEARAFQRSFAGGAAALAIAMSGQMLTARTADNYASPCPMNARVVHASVANGAPSLAQRVARAVIAAALDGF
jgi:hypothetical protein